MAQLIVRNLEDGVVEALKARAKENGRSAEAEHRAILRSVLTEEAASRRAFIEAAAEFRRKARSTADSTAIIRQMRDERYAE